MQQSMECGNECDCVETNSECSEKNQEIGDINPWRIVKDGTEVGDDI